MWNIPLGTKKQFDIVPHVLNYKMPSTLINGYYPGKTIIITAGIHSGEYPGIGATIRLAKDIDPMKVYGRILLIHCVNTSGFWAKTSAILPEDHGNLNVIYPGNPFGSESMRIADYFVKEIFPKSDFIIDLHSGGSREPLTPCLFFPNSPKVRDVSLAIAKATNIPYLIESSSQSGEYSYAAHVLGIPALLLERGCCQQCQEEWINDYKNDLLMILNHLNIYHSNYSQKISEQKVFRRTIYLTAQQDGLWYAYIKENQFIKKGQKLGCIQDFYGNIREEYYAQEDGIIFYYTSGLPVKKGNALVAYGLLSSLEKSQKD